jgi:hypothetical protein
MSNPNPGTGDKQPPIDPLAELAKHFPQTEQLNEVALLEAIQVTLQTVLHAGKMLDRALWGILVLAAVCVAQLLALAMLR